MANTYTPPSTINFFSPSTFTSNLVYFNTQYPASSVSVNVGGSLSTTPYSTISAYTPNTITVPAAGDYVLMVHTGAYQTGGIGIRLYYRCLFLKSGGITTTLNGGITNSTSLNQTITVASTSGFSSSGTIKIDNEEITYTGTTSTTFTGCIRSQNGTSVASHSNLATVTFYNTMGDSSTHIYLPSASNALMGTWFGKVSFPSSGVWTLTPQWRSDSGAFSRVDNFPTSLTSAANNGYYPWTVSLHGTSVFDAINQQQTQYLNSGYTLMTNMDTNTWWGTQTTTALTNSINATTSNTSSITALTTEVNNLSTNVTNLENTVGGLTSTSVTSGGIRIKP